MRGPRMANDAVMAGSTMPRTSRPSSTNKAVSSRNPPSTISASGRDRGGDLRATEAWAVAEIDQHVGQMLHGQPMQGLGHHAHCGKLADPAQRDRGPRLDVVYVRDDRLPDLDMPVRIRVDGITDVGDQVLVVPPQQLDQALFLAGELLVEGAFGGAGVPDDVGDGGVAVAAFDDRRGDAVEQPVKERVGRVPGMRITRTLIERNRHIASLGLLRSAGTKRYRTLHICGTP